MSNIWICRFRNCHGLVNKNLAGENAAIKGPVAWETTSVTGNIWDTRHTHSQ